MQCFCNCSESGSSEMSLLQRTCTLKATQANESSQGRGSTMFVGANVQYDMVVNVSQTDMQI